MKKLVIFGTSDIAELACFYFTEDSDYEVVAFTVDDEYVKSSEFSGLPLVPFSKVNELYPPSGYEAFVALSYSKLNSVRKEKYLACKSLGYRIASYVSSKANVFSNCKIGENAFLLEDNTIQPFVTIGDNVTLWSGNHIGHHSTIEDNCFISSHVVISGGVTVKDACFIGVNSTLRDHITLGECSVIGAGSLILKDVEPEGVYIGAATERSRIPSTKLRKL